MALLSPGVQVTIIDESNYIPAATNSVPYFVIATAQDKVSGSGIGVAAGTTEANANKVYLITSQRDLTQTFGVPFFYKTTAGTAINGYELNEYGLLAAYSALGSTNRAYVQRVNIDLTELTGTLVRPTGNPANGSWWFDTSTTLWGLFQWNITTGTFTNTVPLVITSSSDLSGGVPSPSFGSIGDYAVDATSLDNSTYYKNLNNDWVLVGSDDWKESWPTVQGTKTVTGTLTPGWTININNQGVTVPSSPDNDLDGLVEDINNANIQGVTAANVDDKLVIYADSSATNDGSSADGQGIVYIDESSTSALLTALGVSTGLYNTPYLQQSPNFTVPRWKSTDTSPRPTGSVWFKTNTPNLGANLSVRRYNSSLDQWVVQTVTLYESPIAATAALDPSGGGKNIAANTVIGWYNYTPEENVTTSTQHQTQTLALFYRPSTGALNVTGAVETPSFTVGDQFTIATAAPGSTTYTTPVTATIGGTGSAADFVAAVSAAGVSNVSASIDSAGYIVLTQSNGNTIKLADVGGDTALSDAGFTSSLNGAYLDLDGNLYLSNWYELDYTASATEPTVLPPDGRLWYYSSTNQVDIMINDGVNGWVGYRNETNDVRGYNLSSTDPNGPIISASAPTEQSDGTSLVYGDLWVDTSDLENYPVIRRWQSVDSVDQWVLIDNTDQTTENGILFADARWSSTGNVNPVTANYPTIKSLLTSNYLDVDAPDSALYPSGMLLFNTRRSGYNVKSFQVNYFNAQDFDYPSWDSTTTYAVGDQVLAGTTLYVAIQAGTNQNPASQTAYWQPLETDTWVTASGNRNDGSPYMGRQAQRIIIVNQLKSGVDANTDIREEQREFNLLACPGYPEVITNLIALNNDRDNTGFVVGDTQLRLTGTGTDIEAYAATNSVSDPYAATFYPSCQTVDLSGSAVVQPPSHMMVRTMIRNDDIAYPWLAPAGTQRGVVDNADNIGYINARTGEFVTLGVNQALRDVLYERRINPITFVPGVGITNFGNKTTYDRDSALNRINVGRLVAFIRARLQSIGKNYLFEPNDQITRNEISNAINSLMVDLVAKRGIYDYLVVCDDSNNTPARIDANELWVDIAIEPVKAVEFIYIPVRLKNTGEIAAGVVASSQTV
jgi:hypothetical protein